MSTSLNPDVLLLAAERLHWQIDHLHNPSPDPFIGNGCCYACTAIDCALMYYGERGNKEAYLDALFSTFNDDADNPRPHFIWDKHGNEYEERILAVLLLREIYCQS